MAKTAFAPPKTYFSYGTDQNNIAENGYPLTVWSIEQELDFPTLYSAEKESRNIEYSIASTEYEIEKNRLLKEVSMGYYEYTTLSRKIESYRELDSIYKTLLVQYEKRTGLNDISKLEYLNMKSKSSEISVELNKMDNSLGISFNKLKVLVNSPGEFTIIKNYDIIPETLPGTDSLTVYNYLNLLTEYEASLVKVAKRSTLPSFLFNYFIGSNNYAEAKNYHGFEVGVNVPLFYGSYKNNIKSAKISYESSKMLEENEISNIEQRIFAILAQLEQNADLIKRYEETDLPLAEEIKRVALESYSLGEIDFLNFASSMKSALDIESAYYDAVFSYITNYLEILYFTN